MTERRNKPAEASPSPVGELIQSQVRLPPRYEGDVVVANQIGVTYLDGFFLLSVAFAAPILNSLPDVEVRRLAQEGIESRILAQYAIPAEKFVQTVEAFSDLINNMRTAEILPPVEAEG